MGMENLDPLLKRMEEAMAELGQKKKMVVNGKEFDIDANGKFEFNYQCEKKKTLNRFEILDLEDE